jgi:hypothetical protein
MRRPLSFLGLPALGFQTGRMASNGKKALERAFLLINVVSKALCVDSDLFFVFFWPFYFEYAKVGKIGVVVEGLEEYISSFPL